MATLSYKEFTKLGEKGDNSSNLANSNITYFYLADDGDEAVVRFNVASEEDLTIYSVHSVEAGGKRRTVACLRESLNQSVDTCPLCAAKNKVYFKAYIQMVKYTPDEKGMTAEPVVWERPAAFTDTLKEYLDNYGDLREELFKIVRKGKKGDTNTTYVIIPLGSKSMVFNATTCPADFSDFENYSVLGRVIGQRTAEDMEIFLKEGNFPGPKPKNQAVKEDKPVAQNIPESWKKDTDSFELTQKDMEMVQKEAEERKEAPVQETPAEQKQEDKPTGPRRYNFF